jgi:hypothetical protein
MTPHLQCGSRPGATHDPENADAAREISFWGGIGVSLLGEYGVDAA